MYAFPKHLGVRSGSFVINGERHGIVGIYNAVMFYQMATWIFADIVYPSFVVTFSLYLTLFVSKPFVDTHRIVPCSSVTFCSEIDNLCHIVVVFVLLIARSVW
nr:MAG TPA: hypothetical protein [Caudoviricetes sp.]